MPAPTPAEVDGNVPPDPTQIPDAPPEEEFWQRYNKRLEFPIATVAAVLLHLTVAACLVFFFLGYFGKNVDKSGVPVSLVPDMGGLDDEGTGSAGSGGITDPLKEAKSKGAQILAISNVLESSIPRLADHAFYTHAGPEIGVASTRRSPRSSSRWRCSASTSAAAPAS